MATVTLDHVNLITKHLDRTVAFYEQAFGLLRGAYPGELSTGAWLYDSGGRPVIHTQEVAPETYEGFAARSNPRRGTDNPLLPYGALAGSGALDHVALVSDDYDGIRDRLDGMGLAYQTNEIPSAGINQIFVTDPNGVLIEVNCRIALPRGL